MIRRPPRSTLFPTRRSSDLHRVGAYPNLECSGLGDPLHVCVAEHEIGGGQGEGDALGRAGLEFEDRKSTRLNSSHSQISYAVFCLKKKKDRCLCKSAIDVIP